MKKETLLEKAKKVVPKRADYSKINDEDIDLVLAWVNGEITSVQLGIAKGIKVKTGNYLYYCSGVLRRAVQREIISIKKL